MAYESESVEKKWRKIMEESSYYQANPKSGKPPYCIVIPPPNVTGKLHMGHALVDTLQDILVRYKRMDGFEVLWQPGTDHAGISTQTVVERHLMATENKRRTDFDRDTFLSHVWNWKKEHEDHIIKQLKRLGCSCDWSRLRFTMDEGCHEAVITVFKKMVADGLIYRGDYLVNWDTVTQTALADDEVEYEEKASFMWHFHYGELIIATTRPETLLGDTAVAVNQSDERYKHLIGKTLTLPLMNREIPIIADHYVDPDFGTGVVKITPAHDPNDYEVGLRHNLPMINIMTPDGKINENGGKFEGLTMSEARKAVVEEMDKLGLLLKVEPYVHRVGVSYRSKAVIEPYLSKQWFVKLTSFKGKLIDAVKSGKVKLIPKAWENTYFHWIENLRDWCISRQLWWGHRIPIWYKKDDPDTFTTKDPQDPENWEQEEDVLDTWFSSALWPFSSLGWPQDKEYVEKFYPNSTLITGHDILFFWVARMILMGEYVMGEVPFKETFLHGLIYGKSYFRETVGYVSHEEKKAYDLDDKSLPSDVSAKWEKMSKSKGNVIDPLEVIHDYGTDALRFALTFSCTHARQIDLDMRRFEEFKNFMNKLHNASRFIFMNMPRDLEEITNLQLEDKWILSKTARLIKDVRDHLDAYTFDQLAYKTYHYFWDEFCAIYLELTKNGTDSQQKLLAVLLSIFLRLIHPIAPYITEEIYSELKEKLSGLPIQSDPILAKLHLNFPAVCIAPYPESMREWIDSKIETTFESHNKVIYAIRNIRAEMQLPPSMTTDIYLSKADPDLKRMITKLIRVSAIYEGTLPGNHASAKVEGIVVTIPIPEEMREKEQKRLLKEKEKLEKQIASLRAKLSNPHFAEKAPKDLVNQTKATLAKHQTSLKELLSRL